MKHEAPRITLTIEIEVSVLEDINRIAATAGVSFEFIIMEQLRKIKSDSDLLAEIDRLRDTIQFMENAQIGK